MEKICHPHNMLQLQGDGQPRYGLRVSLPPGDTFRRLLGDDWQKEQWFQTPEERDRALSRIRLRHPYYRIGDNPSLVVEAIER